MELKSGDLVFFISFCGKIRVCREEKMEKKKARIEVNIKLFIAEWEE